MKNGIYGKLGFLSLLSWDRNWFIRYFSDFVARTKATVPAVVYRLDGVNRVSLTYDSYLTLLVVSRMDKLAKEPVILYP